MSGEVLDTLQLAAIAQEAEEQALAALARVTALAKTATDALAAVQAIQSTVTDALAAVGVDHRWTGTQLQIRLRDGSYGTAVDLRGATGPVGPVPVLHVGTVTEGAVTVVAHVDDPANPVLDFALPRGFAAWTPVLAAVSDGARRVYQVVDWIGGQGTKPATGYLAPGGLVADIASATDFRGAPGAGDVVGPSASTDGEVFLASGTGGKTLKRTNTVPSAYGLARLADADAAAQRAALSLVPGTNVQAWDPDLDALAALTTAAFGRSLLTGASAAAVKTLLAIAAGDVSGLGSAALLTAGAAAGNVPVLDGSGKLLTSILPALAISDTFVAASQVAMLALTAERGDVAVRTDLNKSYILKADGASTLANWQELLTPTDQVLSVAGLQGAITAAALKTALAIASADITDSTATGRSVLTVASVAALRTLIGLSAVALSGAYADLSGTPTIPTAAAAADIRTGTDTTKYVTAAVLSGSQALTALTDAATIAWDGQTGYNKTVTLGGNRTLGAISNPVSGQPYVLLITQDATGSRTLAYNAAYDFGGAGAPTLSTTAGTVDMLLLFCIDATTPKFKAGFSKGVVMYPFPAAMLLAASKATSTWNPADKNAGLTLSNSNLTVTDTGTNNTAKALRGIKSRSSGLWYFEVTVVTLNGGASCQIGVLTSTPALNSQLGSNGTNGDAIQCGSSSPRHQPNNVVQGISPIAGSVVGIAVNVDAGKIYYNVNGTWSSAGAPGGTGYSITAGASWFPALNTYGTGDKFTLNTGSRSFASTLPSGYSPWG